MPVKILAYNPLLICLRLIASPSLHHPLLSGFAAINKQYSHGMIIFMLLLLSHLNRQNFQMTSSCSSWYSVLIVANRSTSAHQIRYAKATFFKPMLPCLFDQLRINKNLYWYLQSPSLLLHMASYPLQTTLSSILFEGQQDRHLWLLSWCQNILFYQPSNLGYLQGIQSFTFLFQYRLTICIYWQYHA